MNDKKQDEYKAKNCLTCAHRFDDAHCELIECWEFSGWTAASQHAVNDRGVRP